jgi:ABC-type lipoprotein export system ATPase subunit
VSDTVVDDTAPTDPAPEPELAVDIEGVTKRFGPTVAVDHVSLQVRAGEFAVVVGPSGSGKSTLMHLLAALEKPTSGQLVVHGHRLDRHAHGLNHYRRLEVGLVFQLHNLIPRLTARQNVELAMFGTHRGHRERARRASELLELVDLAGKERRKPPALSGGERQRVAIARALANEPALLLADEPTSGLDDVAATQVIDVFHRLVAERAVTVLAVSHDARLNSRADRTIELVGGQIR